MYYNFSFITVDQLMMSFSLVRMIISMYVIITKHYLHSELDLLI